jgi:hypothetical protein
LQADQQFMTCSPTDGIQMAQRYINKLLAGVLGVAVFAIGASVALWRAGTYIPNLKFSSLLFGLPSVGFSVATVVLLFRLRASLKHAKTEDRKL